LSQLGGFSGPAITHVSILGPIWQARGTIALMDLDPLYREHRERALVWATLRGLSEADAEDVVHEAFRALASLPSPPRSVPAWLRATTFVLARRHRERFARRREADIEMEHIAAGPTPEGALGDEQVRAVLLGLVGRLERTRQEVLLRHVVEGEPIEQIAASQRVPFETAKKRLRLARADLRDAIERSRARERRTAGTASFGLLVALERRWRFGAIVGAAAAVGALLVPRAAELAGDPAEDSVVVNAVEPRPLAFDLFVQAPHEEERSTTATARASRASAPSSSISAGPVATTATAPSELSEAELLTLARRALDGGALIRARAFLQRHAAAYPHGSLALEREQLRARAAAL